MNEQKRPSLPPPGEEAIQLDKKYVILAVEEFKSEVQGFLGWRVTLDGGGDDILAFALWTRDIVGRSSKLGSFLAILGNEPDAWVGHIIKFQRWVERDRLVELVK